MAQLFEQGYALVVGVGQDLPTTVDDASAVAALLCDPTRCAYPPDQVCLLTSTAAHRQAVLDGLDWLAATAGSEATALVYFSGHGLETPDYYLAPFGYNLGALDQTMIAAALFNEKLRAIKTQKLVIILDCCYAGGQAEAKAVTKAPLLPDVLQTLGGSRGRVVIASSRKDETSLAGHPYSLFTAALLEALAGYGSFENDGYARVLDVTMWVGRQVPARSQEGQHPIIKVSNLQDNFALAWYAAGEKRIKPLAWKAQPAPAATTTHAAQSASWQRQLASFRQNLILIEERMSEYIEFTAIPLQLIKTKQQTEARIAELEGKLGIQT